MHERFIAECSSRLSLAISPGGKSLHRLLSHSSRLLAAFALPKFTDMPCPAT